MKIREKEYIYVREGFIRSIVSDIFTFGSMLSFFFVNFHFLGNKWYIDIFAIIFILMFTYSKIGNTRRRFSNKQELIKYLESQND